MKYKLTFNIIAIALLLMSCTENVEKTQSSDDSVDLTEEDIMIKAPEVVLTNVNKPVFFDFTSTGCAGCGGWGKPTFESIKSSQNKNIVPIAIHIKYGDPLITGVSNDIAGNRIGQLFTPQLWINNTNGMVITGGRIDGEKSIANLESEIELIKASEVEILVGVSSIISEDKIVVRYKTNALKDLEGDYYLGVYVMENKIYDTQTNGTTDPTEHNNVIRVSNNGGFGSLISPEYLIANVENEGSFSFNLEDDWNMKNLYATAIVWKKDGNNFFVVNANNNLL